VHDEGSARGGRREGDAMNPTQREDLEDDIADARACENTGYCREHSAIVALADRVKELERDRAECLEVLGRWNAVEDMDDEGPTLLEVTEMLLARIQAAPSKEPTT
jgi:hypothetical protein